MFVNPSRALVEKPSLVASSSGSAKKARYARLFPSTRNRSASRAGASSSWSSAPVSVFGDISASLRRMARLELVPFADEHLEDAARLLAARHARHRRAESVLPERFEEHAAARVVLEQAWRADGASGAAALRDGDLTGYLLAAPRDPEVWGENVWVEAAGHAVEQAEDVRDLYAAAAARWVDEGRTRHYALVPATDPALVDAWFRLGFGQQQAHGIREVPGQSEPGMPDGVETRRPTEDEIDALLEVDLALQRHQRSSPVFSDRPLPTEQEIRDEWIDTLTGDDEDVL